MGQIEAPTPVEVRAFPGKRRPRDFKRVWLELDAGKILVAHLSQNQQLVSGIASHFQESGCFRDALQRIRYSVRRLTP